MNKLNKHKLEKCLYFTSHSFETSTKDKSNSYLNLIYKKMLIKPIKKDFTFHLDIFLPQFTPFNNKLCTIKITHEY